VLVFCAMTLPVLGVAGAWSIKGYWLILPFAGLELLALGIALAITVRRGRYREIVRFDRRRVRVRRPARRLRTGPWTSPPAQQGWEATYAACTTSRSSSAL